MQSDSLQRSEIPGFRDLILSRILMGKYSNVVPDLSRKRTTHVRNNFRENEYLEHVRKADNLKLRTM